MNYNLKNLCEKYNCDKLDHAYIEIYEKYFANLKNQRLNLLEIGVSDGASIKVWSDYFVNSNVVGIDIKNIDIEKKGLDRKNINIYQGSQSDKSFIDKIIGIHKNFDIIIDDGSHYPKDVIKSFDLLFPVLNLNGLYFVEDLQTSYNHFFFGNAFDLKYSKTHMNFFKHLTDSLNYQEIANPLYRKRKYDSKITNLSFYHNLVVVRKGINNKESNIVENNSYEKKRYQQRIFVKGKRIRYFIKYLVIYRMYTIALYIFYTLKKLILFRF